MRIEVSGDLELIKNKEFFEIFGNVKVVRGQYDLFGRTFVIDDGTINFQGGEEMMPVININATYTFRSAQRTEQELSVAISGTSEKPSVVFTLNGSSINEGDAFSYILFGKSMNELSLTQQENLQGAGGGSLAESAAASILSSQISKFLGDKLDVDYIEIRSEGGFENATVVVGKYITNDLFVSYEQRFGETTEKDLSKYEVKLEYELFRFLFFQLNNSSRDSGFDVIFKLEAE
jgi:translocation and assembly module TamB